MRLDHKNHPNSNVNMRSTLLLCICALLPLAAAFITPLGSRAADGLVRSTVTATSRHSPLVLLSSNTLEASATATNSTSSSSIVEPLAGTWECNEEAECVQVPECNDDQCRTSLDVRIHGEWYDLTGTSVLVQSRIKQYTVYSPIALSHDTTSLNVRLAKGPSCGCPLD
jgi:hypothetical protein